MAGPYAAPAQLQNDPAQAPPPAGSMGDQELLGHLQAAQGAQAPPQQAPAAPGQPEPQIDDASLLAQLQSAGYGAPSTPAPDDPNAPPSTAEAPTVALTASEFGKNPTSKLQIFKHWAPELESRIGANDTLQIRKPGEAGWTDAKGGWFESPKKFFQHLASFAPEAMEMGVQTGALVAGAAQGAAEGAGAGSVAGPVGTAGGALAGGLTGAMAAGAGSSVIAGLAREGAAKLLGADTDPALASQLAVQGAIGGAMPVVGAALRKPMAAASDWLRTRVSSAASQFGQGIKASELVNKFDDIYKGVTGRSLGIDAETRQLAGDTAADEVGGRIQNAVLAAETKLGENLGIAQKAAIEAGQLPGGGVVSNAVPEFAKRAEETLKGQYAVQMRPKVTDLSPTQFEVTAQEGANPALKPVAELLQKVKQNGGLTAAEHFDLMNVNRPGSVTAMANRASDSPTPIENTMRYLNVGLAKDRDAMLSQILQGRPEAEVASDAYATYRESIDTLKDLSKRMALSPEKAANSFFRDLDSIRAVKAVMSNPDAAAIDGHDGFQAATSSWLLKHVQSAFDSKTGIVDLPALYNRLVSGNGRPIAEELLGSGALKELGGLANTMSKVSWQGLLKNPDSMQSSGVARALAKFALSRGNPAYGANVLGAAMGYNPEILELVQKHGIRAFAEEAKTAQERSMWMRSGRMIDKMLSVTTVAPQIPGTPTRVVLPIESSMLPSLLNAAVRPAGEAPAQTQLAKQEAVKTWQQQLAEKEADYQAQSQAAALSHPRFQPQTIPLEGPGSGALSGPGSHGLSGPGASLSGLPAANPLARGGARVRKSGRRR